MNLYVHFPFCRSKCAYCTLVSRGGAKDETRESYVRRIVREIAELPPSGEGAHTIYFGGGTPALCPLASALEAIRDKGFLSGEYEFTVELHPLDATQEAIALLTQGGVNRVSLGVQTFDDDALSFLNRHHTAADAIAAINALRPAFPSLGIDLIVGLPTPPNLKAIAEVLPKLDHASVYTLIRESNTRLDLDARKGRTALPGDAESLAEFSRVRDILDSAGFIRYEIANFARPGFECRHNFAVWRGEDYIGIGDGACGRREKVRTTGADGSYKEEILSDESDVLERALFSLRTSDGIDLARVSALWPTLDDRLPTWRDVLSFHAAKGLLSHDGDIWRLTRRGAEVCDSILADLV